MVALVLGGAFAGCQQQDAPPDGGAGTSSGPMMKENAGRAPAGDEGASKQKGS